MDSVSDNVSISVQEQIDTISTGDDGNFDDEDYVDNDEIDEAEWHDRELTPTKYRYELLVLQQLSGLFPSTVFSLFLFAIIILFKTFSCIH